MTNRRVLLFSIVSFLVLVVASALFFALAEEGDKTANDVRVTSPETSLGLDSTGTTLGSNSLTNQTGETSLTPSTESQILDEESELPANPATPTEPTVGQPLGNLDSQIFSASIDELPLTSPGQTKDQFLNIISPQFGTFPHSGRNNFENLSIVDDPAGRSLQYRSSVGNSSHIQFSSAIPVHQETYLVYRFKLEEGFDAGDGAGQEGMPSHSTGIKLPGLMRGSPAANTGGNHTAGGFSGRLMIRGTRKSDGVNSAPREGISIGAYIYGQRINGQNIASGFGRSYYFLDGFESQPFLGHSSGLSEGVGDPRIWDLEEDRWVTLVLGYRVDNGNGWFKAWTKTEGIDDQVNPSLFIPNIDWTGGSEGADNLLFQNFWGGQGSVWHPDKASNILYRDFAVFTDEADAIAFANS